MQLNRLAVPVIGAALLTRRSITLRPCLVHFSDRTPLQVADSFRSRLADHPDLVAADDDTIVARFAGKAGPFPYRTVEVVDVSSDRITFEHLRGPFIRCVEAFELRAAGDGTDVVHVGSFTMRGGLVGWAFGLLWIRSLFERHVAAELQQMSSGLQA